MIKKYEVIFAVIGFIIVFSFLEGWGADWKLYEENDFGRWFYDAENITHPSKDTVKAWGKTVYTDKGVMRTVTDMRVISEKYRAIYEKYKDLESKDLAASYKRLESKYKDLSYEHQLLEFNCANRKSRTLKGTSYARDGSVLSTYSPETPDWNEVMPETVNETLYKIVCKQKESKQSKDNLSRFQDEKPRTGANMITRIGEYYLGQDIKAIRGLVEFTPEEYAVFKAFPGWFDLPGEKVFKAPDVTFNRRVWYLTIGALHGRICILALQYISSERGAASSLLKETLGFVKLQMGEPTEQTRSPERYVWDSAGGSVSLAKREAMDLCSINFLLTGKGPRP